MLLTDNSRKEADRQAMRENKIKQELERDLTRKLRPVFNSISRDFLNVYTELGLIPDQNRYRETVLEALQKYMKKAGEIFSQNIRNDLKKGLALFEVKAQKVEIPEEEEEDVAADIAATIGAFIKDESERQTDLIFATNISQMKEAITEAQNDLLSSGQMATLAGVGAIAFIRFKNKATKRVDTIASQNIGVTESFSKQTEANRLNKSGATVAGEKVENKLKKKWNAILDSKTRPAHVAADGQYMDHPISVDHPYIVDGEIMQYPRDPNGSAGNVINCRCTNQITTV